MTAQRGPVIGFTLDAEAGSDSGFSRYPWYALRDNYLESVARHGAVPIALPHEIEQVEAYLDLIEGLVLTGGNFDVPPEMYGETTRSDTVSTKPRRTCFEWALAEGALRRGIPILGICGGEQLINVIQGGTLLQHIPDSIPQALAHRQLNPAHEAAHPVSVVPGSLLSRIVGRDQISVNSRHHQAVAQPGRGVLVNARAPDGVIEGIELPEHRFCLGVQWHPEYRVSEADEQILAALVAAARAYGETVGARTPAAG